MTAAARPMQNKVDMLTNVAIQMSIKYIDVYPDSGKGYGASVRFKGTVDGAEAIVYPKGKCWATLKALKAAGVIDPSGEYAEEPTEKYSIPVRHADAEIVYRQGAGEKHGTLAVTALGGAAPVAAPKLTATATHNTIGRVPWEDQETGAPPVAQARHVPAAPALGAVLDNVATEYQRCLEVATNVAIAVKLDRFPGDIAGAVQAIAATMYIESNKRTR